MKSIFEICEECQLPLRQVPAGEPLLEEGLQIGTLFVLKEGTVEVSKEDVELNRVSTPGSMFGEMSILMNSPHTATVKTVTDSIFYVAENADQLMRSNLEINYHIAQLLATRLTSVTSYLVDLQRQFASHQNHLGMVDEVLESLLHHQSRKTKD